MSFKSVVKFSVPPMKHSILFGSALAAKNLGLRIIMKATHRLFSSPADHVEEPAMRLFLLLFNVGIRI